MSPTKYSTRLIYFARIFVKSIIPHPQHLQRTKHFLRDLRRWDMEFPGVSVAFHLGKRQPCNGNLAYALSSPLPAPLVLYELKDPKAQPALQLPAAGRHEGARRDQVEQFWVALNTRCKEVGCNFPVNIYTSPISHLALWHGSECWAPADFKGPALFLDLLREVLCQTRNGPQVPITKMAGWLFFFPPNGDYHVIVS